MTNSHLRLVAPITENCTDGQGVPQDYVQAHMWLNLAASQFPSSEKENCEIAVKDRDLIASKMTPKGISERTK